MRTLQIEKHGSNYVFKDCDTVIYSAICEKKGYISLRNAYQEEILNANSTQSGFRLFRGSKPKEYQLKLEGMDGLLMVVDNHYECKFHEVQYLFEGHGNRIIMRSSNDALGYVQDTTMNLLSGLYSAELCAFYAIFSESKDKVFREESNFEQYWKQILQE